jgi:FMN-dependent oxidoreductase (nitrilotriacetate monooxygenase family)
MAHSEMMHLTFDLSFNHADGKWNVPGGWVGYDYYPNPKMYQDIARIAERGKLDMLFFGDGTGVPDSYEGKLDAGAKWGIQWPRHDKAAVIPLMAAATGNVGFGYTLSPTFMHPYHIARLANSLDHITGGRLALNLVTSTRPADHANYGYDQLVEHGTRYERMEEFVEICQQLWDSVEQDAVVLDHETGVFADPDKVHAINYRGKFWDVRGPLNCLPSPQVHPVLLQAGQSERGIRASAKFADYVFASPGTPEFQRSHRARLDEYAADVGRTGRDIGILWGIQVVVAETEAEARAKQARMVRDWPVEAWAAYLSYNNGFDFSKLPPRFTLGEARDLIEAEEASQMGYVQRLILQHGDELEMTFEELVAGFRDGQVGGAIVGDPVQIADRMEALHENGGKNGGFMISGWNGPTPRSQAEVVELLIPELQRRGVFRKEYDGSTLRDRMNN